MERKLRRIETSGFRYAGSVSPHASRAPSTRYSTRVRGANSRHSGQLVYLSTCLLVYLSTCLPATLPTCHLVYLPTCLPATLSTCLLVYLSTNLPIYQSTNLPLHL